jgi:hypothetical protein
MKTQEILENFRSKKCACGKAKGENKSHCRSCYFKLPQNLRNDLYKRFFAGYEEGL